jgi:hypothetical protein
MVKVSVFYPNQAGNTFDMRYYQEQQITGDIPNYTNVAPIVQISEVRM